MSDFPAAHSMDTYWFAIDADENIAVFDTGENGALPCSARRIFLEKQIHDVHNLIPYLPKDERGIGLVKTAGEMAAIDANLQTLHNQIRHSVAYPRETLSSMVLVLSSDRVIPKLEIIESQLAFRFAGEPVVIYLSYCHIPLIEKLIESREILGGKRVNLPFNSHLIGLFSYEQRADWEYNVPTPYTRDRQPEQPLKLEELPEDIQDLIAWTWFEELRFQDAEIIQPIEYTECDTWDRDTIWIDTQGTIHEHLPNR